MTTRSSKARPGSPLKKQSSQANNSQYQHDDFPSITERDVENEHLKTTIFALSEQVTVSASDSYLCRWSTT